MLTMKIEWSDTALLSLKEAGEYAREKFGDHQLQKLIDRVEYACDMISQHPFSYPVDHSLHKLSLQYRRFPLFPNLNIIYRIDEENDTCLVVLVWNTRRNPSTLLKIVSSQDC